MSGEVLEEFERYGFTLTNSTHKLAECETCAKAASSAVTHAIVTGSRGATYALWTSQGEGGGYTNHHKATVQRFDIPTLDEVAERFNVAIEAARKEAK